MKQILTFSIILLLMTGCSLMKNMMMKRMENMSDEERMEMMSEMMRRGDSSSCSEMMENMSGKSWNDTLSKAAMACKMMPLCVENIMLTLDDSLKAQFLVDITRNIIVNGYDTIPVKNRPYFKAEMIRAVQELE
ncbi:MAG: hypothetical protein JSV22_11810 [Bacteroidales bacterium]|nr:MAG: hypothetical protein JSV22_11810 [Bacteroidales bacterium]